MERSKGNKSNEIVPEIAHLIESNKGSSTTTEMDTASVTVTTFDNLSDLAAPWRKEEEDNGAEEDSSEEEEEEEKPKAKPAAAKAKAAVKPAAKEESEDDLRKPSLRRRPLFRFRLIFSLSTLISRFDVIAVN